MSETTTTATTTITDLEMQVSGNVCETSNPLGASLRLERGRSARNFLNLDVYLLNYYYYNYYYNNYYYKNATTKMHSE